MCQDSLRIHEIEARRAHQVCRGPIRCAYTEISVDIEVAGLDEALRETGHTVDESHEILPPFGRCERITE